MPTKMSIGKTCSRCKVKKPKDSFYFKDKAKRYRHSWCKTCLSTVASERYRSDRQHGAALRKAWARANPEKVIASALKFRETNADVLKLRQRRYDEKRRERRKSYRAANREHIKARNAEYRSRTVAARKAYNASYYLANTEAVNARIKRAQAANPSLYNQLHKAAKHRRKVRLTNNGPSERFTDLEIFERDNWRCQLCGGAVDRTLPYPNPMSASLDHVLPIARGGGHTRKNAQLAHLGCNSRKRDRAA